MVISIKERIEKNYQDREKNNDKSKELRKKLGQPRHKRGKIRLKILLRKLRKKEVPIQDTLDFITRERADADYQGEIRGLKIGYELGQNTKTKGGKK